MGLYDLLLGDRFLSLNTEKRVTETADTICRGRRTVSHYNLRMGGFYVGISSPRRVNSTPVKHNCQIILIASKRKRVRGETYHMHVSDCGELITCGAPQGSAFDPTHSLLYFAFESPNQDTAPSFVAAKK